MNYVNNENIDTKLELISYSPENLTFDKPILLVHGMWQGAWCWDETFLPYFNQKGFACYAFSLIGHGKSPSKRFFRFTRIKDYVANLRSITEQFDEHPILIGHSMGGFIVQKYLEKYNAPGAVLLASIPPSGTFRTTMKFFKRHPLAFLKINLAMKMIYVVHPKRFAKESLFNEAISDEKLDEYYEKLQNEAYFAYLDTMLFSRPKTKKIKAPMLVLGGTKDKFFTEKEFTSTAKVYNADLKMFPNMAHNMMLEENWIEIADEIMSWCKNLTGSE